jgi:hypothetical protein
LVGGFYVLQSKWKLFPVLRSHGSVFIPSRRLHQALWWGWLKKAWFSQGFAGALWSAVLVIGAMRVGGDFLGMAFDRFQGMGQMEMGVTTFLMGLGLGYLGLASMCDGVTRFFAEWSSQPQQKLEIAAHLETQAIANLKKKMEKVLPKGASPAPRRRL